MKCVMDNMLNAEMLLFSAKRCLQQQLYKTVIVVAAFFQCLFDIMMYCQDLNNLIP